MRPKIDAAREAGNDDIPRFAKAAREPIGEGEPRGGGVARADDRDGGLLQRLVPAFHGENAAARESICLKSGGYSGSPSAMKRTPARRAAASSRSTSSAPAMRIGRFAPPRRASSGNASSAARAPPHLVDERAKRARTDVFRADEPQPIEALLVGEPHFWRLSHVSPCFRCAISVPLRIRAIFGRMPDPQITRERAEDAPRLAVCPSAERGERRGDARGERRRARNSA